ncbi:MAG: aminotransferase class I/II-fold pyridoxal phosphate-dependent enzyme, partial [Patescibacteria group bacterium]
MFNTTKKQFEDELAEIKQSGMWKEEKVITGLQGTEIEVDGKQLLNFCGNNYLGLAGSKEMQKQAKEAIDLYGFGMASVRFICGTQTVHKELEKEISDFFDTEDAIVYTSCFDANTGLFETILKEGDALFSDELNHASIIDGVRLCKAERFRYAHADMNDLEKKLKEFVGQGTTKKILIATDGVFSMDGEIAPLKSLADLADEYGALLMVDDSHGSGVLGAKGRGSVEGLMGRIDIHTSTFGKALGGAGGGFTA